MLPEETIDKSVFEEIPTEKIYSENAIRVGTFLAGPLVAGYCISENFKVFNDLEKAKKTWLFTILLSVLIIVLACLLPENIPSFIFPIIYVSITSYFLKTYQEKEIQKHLSNGGETHGGWRVFVIGLLSVLVLFSVVLSFVMLADYV
ncbi:hypothetical protein [Flavobacterium hungaricum]|uniref:DUF4190 domain-containing protein n=1 Tax=Flavobacterium hungaricum TaxID=2082725 RepID=A0ABR9TN08_9FLAO|nr:hypothetical protein [Flavobacterium hungaricum]MBE8726713.1 hypothetical protein [Flavobacterium hungaricum]